MQAIDEVVKLLEQSRSLLLITGAGVSADSGLPTYRGIGGLYTVNCTEDGLPIEEVLSGGTMRRRPELTWKYLGQIEQACRGARFNHAHAVMAEMECCFDRVWILMKRRWLALADRLSQRDRYPRRLAPALTPGVSNRNAERSQKNRNGLVINNQDDGLKTG